MKRCMPLVFLLFFMSCKDESGQQPRKSKGIPNALQEKSVDVSSLSKKEKEDLVEVLYAELVRKNSSLKTLDNEITTALENQPDSLRGFNLYEQNNSTYYTVYNRHLPDIQDSVLRKRMKVIIDSSTSRYKTFFAAHQKISDSVRNMYNNLSDLYRVLKLTRTLSVMEAYQKENMPDTAVLIRTMELLQSVMARTDSLINTGTIVRDSGTVN